jgi:hypothetical protein
MIKMDEPHDYRLKVVVDREGLIAKPLVKQLGVKDHFTFNGTDDFEVVMACDNLVHARQLALKVAMMRLNFPDFIKSEVIEKYATSDGHKLETINLMP